MDELCSLLSERNNMKQYAKINIAWRLTLSELYLLSRIEGKDQDLFNFLQGEAHQPIEDWRPLNE